MKLSKKEILEYQQNKPPYLMIDFAENVIPGKSANGYKDLKEDEWFFKVHWQNDPNMPGMLQIEALVQMAALAIVTLPGNKGKVIYLTKANNLEFKKKIVIGNRLNIETKIISWKRGLGLCSGIGKVKGEIACKADFNIVDPVELKKFGIQGQDN